MDSFYRDITCEVNDLIDREELALKMKYILPESIDPIDINSVKIWLDFAQHLKDKSFINREPRAFNMEVIPCANQTNEHTTTFRGFQSFNGDWIEFDAMPVLRSWFEIRHKCFNVSLTMKSWSINYCRTIQIPEHKPFLTAHYKTNAEVNVPRMKRSRNCTKSSSECCKEDLYVSFSEIGWDKWIIFPEGYEAYYCKGSCSGPSALTLSATAHNSVIQGLLHVSKDVSSCCAPTRMLPMDFFVQFNNSSATLTTIPDIVIDTCGCM